MQQNIGTQKAALDELNQIEQHATAKSSQKTHTDSGRAHDETITENRNEFHPWTEPFKFEYMPPPNDKPVVKNPDYTTKYFFNPVQGNWYTSYNIDITSPADAEDDPCCDPCLCCDECLRNFDTCLRNFDRVVRKCSKTFFMITRAIVTFLRCLIDPMHACMFGFLMLYVHVIQICYFDFITFWSNKVLKPFLHTWYESCVYPFVVSYRVTLDAQNVMLEPCWIMMYRCMTPWAMLYRSMRCCEANVNTTKGAHTV